MVQNGASSNNTNYIEILSEILSPEGHQNCCIGSNITVIFPTGGVASGGPAPAACAAGLFNFIVDQD